MLSSLMPPLLSPTCIPHAMQQIQPAPDITSLQSTTREQRYHERYSHNRDYVGQRRRLASYAVVQGGWCCILPPRTPNVQRRSPHFLLDVKHLAESLKFAKLWDLQNLHVHSVPRTTCNPFSPRPRHSERFVRNFVISVISTPPHLAQPIVVGWQIPWVEPTIP